MTDINKIIAAYSEQLKNPQIKAAYQYLIKFMMRLKGLFIRAEGENFTFGNVSPGYMDYSYFPFYNALVKQHGLRFGIVLNHQNMAFELWLMGQNMMIQKKFWRLFKTSPWMQNYSTMPRYSALEVQLLNQPDFNHEKELMENILQNALQYIGEILVFIESNTQT
ncbi:hypothetical protein [Bartonella sp. HY038]|uniref:DUF7000 family protein n=1 Tax=Bartonella sp. HY038 TaxID=2759660 RepID=UPI0015FD84AC|nr:hypothetical protein [Bartonella sp. HY038]